ncbi:hypothetical protein [Streptosporangium amethystogenes]|nr:hypothetical protein [Streptosporangium amethystogenes]
MHLRHKWEIVETIGRVITQRCSICGRTRVRVTRPEHRADYRLGLG